MGFSLVLPLRVLQGCLSLVVLGLSGYVANWYNVDTLTSSPSQVNFLLFSALWSLLSLVYLVVVPMVLPRASHPFVSLGIEATNVFFWFAGFVALGVFLSRLLFCRGTVCGAAQADTVFSAVLFATWAATVGLAAKDVAKNGRRPARTAATASMAMKETVV